jgi:hypothetical protein
MVSPVVNRPSPTSHRCNPRSILLTWRFCCLIAQRPAWPRGTLATSFRRKRSVQHANACDSSLGRVRLRCHGLTHTRRRPTWASCNRKRQSSSASYLCSTGACGCVGVALSSPLRRNRLCSSCIWSVSVPDCPVCTESSSQKRARSPRVRTRRHCSRSTSATSESRR